MSICAREGCKRMARGDEFCGTLCAKLHFGEVEFDPNASRDKRNRKRRIRTLEKKHGKYIEVTNPDASSHVVDGSFETGKRR